MEAIDKAVTSLKFACDAFSQYATLMLLTLFFSLRNIRIARPCDLYILAHHFYKVILEFTGVYISFLMFAQNIDCVNTLEPPYPLSINVTNIRSDMTFVIFTAVKNRKILQRCVIVMQNHKISRNMFMTACHFLNRYFIMLQ